MKKENESKLKGRFSAFQITAVILCVILFIAILIQICIMVDLKNKTEERKRQEEALPDIPQEDETEIEAWKTIYLEKIESID